MNRWLIGAGAVLVLAGLTWPWLSRIPLGRLPGDFHVHRGHFDLYAPLGTSVLVSLVLTLLVTLLKWWLRR